MPIAIPKLWLYGIAAVAIVGAIWWFSHQRYQAGYKAAQAEMAQAVRKAEDATKAAEAKAAAITEAKDREWQTERNNLQDRITGLLSRPAPAVRLCKPASRSAVPSIPATAGQPDGSAVESGPALRAGDDIGPALVQYGGQCEEYRAQLIRLQAWVASQRSAATN